MVSERIQQLMGRRFVRSYPALVGLPMLVLYLASGFDPRTLRAKFLGSATRSAADAQFTRGYAHVPMGAPTYRGVVNWSMQVTYPKMVPVGSSVLVRAAPVIGNVRVETLLRDLEAQRKPNEDDVMGNAWALFRQGNVSLTLNLAGATVRPDTITQFDPDEPGAWSVHFPAVGTYSGKVSAEVVQRGSPSEDAWDTELTMLNARGAIVTIEAYEPLVSRTNLLSVATLIFGQLLSLPGLYVFVRDVRRHREEARDRRSREEMERLEREQAERRERRIILPNESENTPLRRPERANR